MGGWIKLGKDLPQDFRVRRMARELVAGMGDTERHTVTSRVTLGVTLVLGGLAQLWMHADTFADEDNVIRASLDDIDELTGLKGFGKLMPAEWLEILDADRVKLPDFHEHNGSEARSRSRHAERQARYRRNLALRSSVTQASRVTSTSVTPGSPDQTRPDLDLLRIKTALPEARDVPAPKVKRSKPRSPIRADQEPTEADRAYALAKGPPDADWPSIWAGFRDYHLGKGTLAADWSATWRTWILNLTTRGMPYARRPVDSRAGRNPVSSVPVSPSEATRISNGESLESVLASRAQRPPAPQPGVVGGTPEMARDVLSLAQRALHRSG
jgi:hypothetical protein